MTETELARAALAAAAAAREADLWTEATHWERVAQVHATLALVEATGAHIAR